MFRFLKRNDSEVITPEVVDVPVTTIQSNIAMALALCMEEYLRSVSKTSVDIPNRDTLVREYNTLVDAGLGSSKNARLLQACVPALCLWYSHSQYVGRRVRGQSV